ncbi:redoxin domain-containing protein [bacterium]|nr:redoxin domain-containing protein [bacterium]
MADLLNINQKAPDFVLPADNGSVVSLQNARANGPVLLFFYPGDFTPVCTAEVCAFRDDYHLFRERNIVILGISSDPVERHQRFAEQCRVPFRLLSDTQLTVASLYGARGLLGMRRAYFLIDQQGFLRWQHAEVMPIFKLSNGRILEVVDQAFAMIPSDVEAR